jgi:hypothetical protein
MSSYLKKLITGEKVSYLLETVKADIFYYEVPDLDHETYLALEEESYIHRIKVRFMAEKGYKVVGHYIRPVEVSSEKDRKNKTSEEWKKSKSWKVDVLYYIMQSSYGNESSNNEIEERKEKELRGIEDYYLNKKKI